MKRVFRDATKDDIRDLFEGLETDGWETPNGEKREYAGSTDEKFRKIIKLFYKVVYGQNKFYPEAVEWLSAKVRKGRYGKKIDANMFLIEEEILVLIDVAPSLQKKALFACWYECGGRPEEVLNATNQDILYDTKGIRIILRGKTGERAIRLAVYGPILQQWLDVHPRKNEAKFPLWVSEATNYKNKKLGLRGAEKVIAEAVIKVAPNKNPVPYILRHSRATFLAKKGFNEAKLRLFFGWSEDSDKPKAYIHLSGKDLDNDILALNGDTILKQEEDRIKSSKCVKCANILYPKSNICGNCGLPTSLEKVYLEDITNREAKQIEVAEIKTELQKLREQDKEHDHRWNFMIHMFESLIGEPLTQFELSKSTYGMSSLCYQELEILNEKEKRKIKRIRPLNTKQ